MARPTRVAHGAIVALVLALVVAAPAAAAQPTRTVYPLDLVRHFPAGTGCEFDVTVYLSPGSRGTETDFADGRVAWENHAVHRTIMNDATGATFVEDSVYHEVDRFDADANLIRGSVTGQSVFAFAVGDVTPDGSIADHVYSIFIQGTVTYVIDGTTFATLAISVEGSYADICAAIS